MVGGSVVGGFDKIRYKRPTNTISRQTSTASSMSTVGVVKRVL